MTRKLPIKLGKEPLIEAVFEIRFQSSVPFSATNIIPGIIFQSFPGKVGGVEKLPMADLPEQVRKQDPILASQPLLKIGFEDHLLLIGDNSFCVVCTLPYMGWSSFKAKIIELLSILGKHNLITEVQRHSIKYVNVLEGNNDEDLLKKLAFNCQIGKHQLQHPSNVLLKVESKIDDVIVILGVTSPAKVTPLKADKEISGLVIDVDCIYQHKPIMWTEFMNDIDSKLNSIRWLNKSYFFDCLTEDTLNSLEPVYE